MQDAPEFLKSLAIVFGVLIVEDLIGILLMSVLTAVSSENEDHHPGGQQRYAQAMRNSGADEAIIPEHGGA